MSVGDKPAEGKVDDWEIRIPTWLFTRILKKTSPAALAVYLVLLKHRGQDSQCWPSFETLAEYTSLSRPTICRAIKDLKDAEFLALGKRKTGKGHVNLYTILPPKKDESVRLNSLQTPEGCASNLYVGAPQNDTTPPGGCASNLSGGAPQIFTGSIPRGSIPIKEPIPSEHTPKAARPKVSNPSHDSVAKGVCGDVPFSEFADQFPPEKINRYLAEKEWRKLSHQDRLNAVVGARLHFKENDRWKLRGGEFVTHGQNFLVNRLWAVPPENLDKSSSGATKFRHEQEPQVASHSSVIGLTPPKAAVQESRS